MLILKLLKIKIEHFWLTKIWYNVKLPWYMLLFLPLEWIYRTVIACKKILYTSKILKVIKFNFPIIVIGNLTVGGTGKTPLVIYLARSLSQLGIKPLIVMRGYGGSIIRHTACTRVGEDLDPSLYGDEPVLIAKNTKCPVFIGRNRLAILEFLQNSKLEPKIVICDDGLQDHRFSKDLKIVTIDAKRLFGVKHCLPLGPLREPIANLATTDLIVQNHSVETRKNALKYNELKFNQAKIFDFKLIPTGIYNLLDPNLQLKLADLKIVAAVAGIGNNSKFFDLLEYLGIQFIKHEFPDHHAYQPIDLEFKNNLPIIMTEKDAVKCRKFAKPNFWYLKVAVKLSREKEFNDHIMRIFKNYA